MTTIRLLMPVRPLQSAVEAILCDRVCSEKRTLRRRAFVRHVACAGRSLLRARQCSDSTSCGSHPLFRSTMSSTLLRRVPRDRLKARASVCLRPEPLAGGTNPAVARLTTYGGQSLYEKAFEAFVCVTGVEPALQDPGPVLYPLSYTLVRQTSIVRTRSRNRQSECLHDTDARRRPGRLIA